MMNHNNKEGSTRSTAPARKLLAELQTNEELQAKIKGITDPEELVKKAIEAGYDVTVEDLEAAEKEMKAKVAARNDELSADELESAAGGKAWGAEDASDGHEWLCSISYHGRGWIEEHNEWCKSKLYGSSEEMDEAIKERQRFHT